MILMAISPTKGRSERREATVRTRSRLRRTLNTPLAVGTIVFLAVFVPGVYFWHSYRVKEDAVIFLERADELEKDGKLIQSAGYLFSYLQLRPDDVDVRIRLAETYSRTARTPQQRSRAIDLTYEALGRAPQERASAVRRGLVKLLLEANRFASAETEATKLIQADPSDAGAHRTLALSLVGQFQAGTLKENSAKRIADIGPALERAYELNPGDPELAMALATAYRAEPQLLSPQAKSLPEKDRQKLADACMDQVVAENPKSGTSYLVRFRYRSAYNLPGAKEDLQAALQYAPEDPVVLLTAASEASREVARMRSAKRPKAEYDKLVEEAIQCYERVIQKAPNAERAYLGLGELHTTQGKLDQAVKVWESGLEKCGKESIVLNASLAEAFLVQGKADDAKKRIEIVEASIARLRQLGFADSEIPFAGGVDSLRARLAISQRDYEKAETLLRRAASGSAGASLGMDFAYQAWMTLGALHATTGQHERAVEDFEEAAARRPNAVEPRLAAATRWLAMDRPEPAAKQYEKALAIAPEAETWGLYLLAMLRSQLRLPQSERGWDAFEKALAQAKQAAKSDPAQTGWRLAMVEADYAILRAEEKGRRDVGLKQSHEILRAAEKQYGDSLAALESLALSYERLGANEDADRALERLRKAAPQSPAVCLLCATVLSHRKQIDKAREGLQKGLSAVRADEQRPLRLAMAGLDLRAGRAEEAWQALEKLHGESPDDRGLLQEILEVALELGKLREMEPFEGKLQALAGVEAADWQFYRARRLLLQAEGPQDPRLTEVERLQSEIHKQRPTWSGGPLLRGLLAQRRGNPEQAAQAYEESIRLGERRLAAFQRLVLLLYRLQRFRDADRYLGLFRDRWAAISSELSATELSLTGRAGEMDRALDSARRAAEGHPKDSMAQVWLGELLLLNSKPNEAETAFRRAAESKPADPRAIGALVSFYVRSRKPEQARETLERLAKESDLGAVDKAILLAQGYDLLGDQEKSVANYREAARLGPKNPRIPERLALALLRSDPVEAEKTLRQALKLDPNSPTARRSLAALLAQRGGEKEWQEAIELLARGQGGDSSSEGDQRLQAILFVRRGGPENLAKAQRLLKQLTLDPVRAFPGDRLLLAHIFEAEGDLAASRRELLALASVRTAAPSHVAALIEFLLRQNDLKEAETWLGKLESLAPGSPAALGLRVRWLHAQKRDAEVDRLLEATAEQLFKQRASDPTAGKDPAQEVQLNAAVGDLYHGVDHFAAAERWYRKAMTLDKKQYHRVARAVAGQGRVREAIGLCVEGAASDTSLRAAMVAASLLLQGRPAAEDLAQAEPLLAKALAENKDSVELLISLANLRLVQQRPDEASQLFRRVLQRQPQNLVALNNLATLLGEQPGKADEALRHVDQAIQLAGPQPGLLDTKGTILLYQGKAKESLELLAAAASVPNADPRYHFHLAIAHYRLGDLGQAREALATSQKRDLSRQVLTDGDRRLLAELDAKLR